MKKISGTFGVVGVLAIAGMVSSAPVQASPLLPQALDVKASGIKVSDKTQTADRAVTDVSARRYYRRYGYGYRPHYYRPYGYGYGYRPYYQPYGYYGYGYRRPGIYLGF